MIDRRGPTPARGGLSAIAAALTLLALVAPAGGVELEVGDIILTDLNDDSVIRVDPITGDQTLISSGNFLISPRGVALDAHGRIFVSDEGSDFVVRVDPVTQVQVPVANLSGEPFILRDLQIDAAGDLYLVDAFSDRLVRISPVGAIVIDVFASVSPAVPPFFSNGLAIEADGNFVLTDESTLDPLDLNESCVAAGDPEPCCTGNGTGTCEILPGGRGIYRFDRVSGLLSTLSRRGSFEQLKRVAVEADGKLVVTDSAARAVFRVDPDAFDENDEGANQELVPTSNLSFPVGIAVDANGKILVVDRTAKKVLRFDPLTQMTTQVTAGGLLNAPWAIAIVRELIPIRGILVADRDAPKVFLVDAGAASKGQIPPGDSFLRPDRVFVDQSGRRLVIDNGDTLFRIDGGVQTELASGPPFDMLSGIAVLPDGTILLSDAGNGEIFAVNPTSGAVSTLLPSSPFEKPTGLAVGSRGLVGVIDQGGVAPAVYEINVDTLSVRLVDGGPAPEEAGLLDLTDIEPDPDGAYLVLDAGQTRLLGCDPNVEPTCSKPVIFRISANGFRAVVPLVGTFQQPLGLAKDLDLSLLFVEDGPQKRLHRLDQLSGFVVEVDSGAPPFVGLSDVAVDVPANPPVPDQDLDGFPDVDDVCGCSFHFSSDVAIDSNGNGIPNFCDGDWDENGIVGFSDLPLWAAAFGTDADGEIRVPDTLYDPNSFCTRGNLDCVGPGDPFPCCTGLNAGATCGSPYLCCQEAGTGFCSATTPETACLGAGDPFPCCTGQGIGACVPDDRNAPCTGAGAPLSCCTGVGTGTCSDIFMPLWCEGFADPFTCCSGPGTGTCPTQNAGCVGPGDPRACCTGPQTGTCRVNDPVYCVDAGNPDVCCTGEFEGNCRYNPDVDANGDEIIGFADLSIGWAPRFGDVPGPVSSLQGPFDCLK